MTTMEEYVNAYYGGELGISKRYGISKADDLINTGDPTAAFNTVYGAKVYNQLNTKSEVFKLLKKEPWTQSGWRVLTARHGGTAGIAETNSEAGGALPDTAQPDIQKVEATLAQVATTWEITTKAAMLSEADDGMGNLAAFMRKENSEAHLFGIDQMLLADSETAAGNNFESLDRITISHAANGALNNTATDADLWDITNNGIDRSANAWSDPQVVHNSDTPRALKLEYLDTIIRGALEEGVNYSSLILLTGYDTYQDLKQLMASGNTGSAAQATFRYDLKQGGAGSMNGVAGEAGLAFDSRVGSYDGIPIFLSQHVIASADAASRIYLLDMDNLAFRVAAPTTYLENSNVAVTQKASHEHLLMTAGNLIAYKFKTMGSVRDNA
tara:strand:+ start:267 stop:1418 length:1152 start_codon:yes stop_codon:yes gene_type:complete